MKIASENIVVQSRTYIQAQKLGTKWFLNAKHSSDNLKGKQGNRRSERVSESQLHFDEPITQSESRNRILCDLGIEYHVMASKAGIHWRASSSKPFF